MTAKAKATSAATAATTPPTGRRLAHLGRGLVEAAILLALGIALGNGLELLASRGRFFLDRVPLGPGSGADPMGPAMPFGEHGWVPVPLCLLDVVLLWGAAGRWHPASWWGSCIGAVWGQVPSLVSCTLGILPSVLAVWLLHMPYLCTALAAALGLSVAALSFAALLFWSDLLPLLPRAYATDACARLGVRRAWLTLGHAAFFGAMLAMPPADPRNEPGRCSALASSALASPAAVVDELAAEMRASTPQGMLSATNLVWNVAILTAAIFIVVDHPQGTNGQLWGAAD